MKDTQSRKYQITINNPLDKGLDHNKIKQILDELKSTLYWCMADEVGLETHTPHTHIFIQTRTPVRFSRMKRLFPDAHMEQVRGSAEENRNYVKKSGKWADDTKSDTSIPETFEEWGEFQNEPGQGYRSDITQLYTMIVDGMSNAAIMNQNPKLAAHISRMDKIRQDVLEDRYRNEFRQLDVTYIFGPTAIGKTRSVMERYGYHNVFRVTDYTHPFDRYAQESVLLFEEFRSSLMIGDMLNYLDGYPLALPARYSQRQACYTTVYIISNINLSQQYKNVQENEPATWRAFLRRIHHVLEYNPDKSITDHGSAIDYIFPPSEPLPDWVCETEEGEMSLEQLDLPF